VEENVHALERLAAGSADGDGQGAIPRADLTAALDTLGTRLGRLRSALDALT
jgi:hypothetical protein